MTRLCMANDCFLLRDGDMKNAEFVYSSPSYCVAGHYDRVVCGDDGIQSLVQQVTQIVAQ